MLIVSMPPRESFARSIDWEPTMPFEPGRYQYLRGNVSWRNASPAHAVSVPISHLPNLPNLLNPSHLPTAPTAPTDPTAPVHAPFAPSSLQMWREFGQLVLSATPLQTSSDPDEVLLAVAAAV